VCFGHFVWQLSADQKEGSGQGALPRRPEISVATPVTAGDAVIHVPDQNAMFTGDIFEDNSACYCGDGYFGD